MAVSSSRRTFLVAMFLSFLLGSATCSRITRLSSSQSLVEEKSRLGSTPPTCHNRCNACNPCSPVQVPSLPRPSRSSSMGGDEVTGFAQYSNYKPLGWKCRCAGRFYDP